jgi:hypothetical protein
MVMLMALPARAQDADRVRLDAGAGSFAVPSRYLLLDYRRGGAVEPILARWFGFRFWLGDRKPAGEKEKRPDDLAIEVVGVEVRPVDPDEKRLLPAHRAWIIASHPLLYDYGKSEEFELEKHEYCGLDAATGECPAAYISKPGSSPQVFTRSEAQDRYYASLKHDPTYMIQFFYPEDRIVFWLTLPEAALPRWKTVADETVGLIRSWRLP